MKKSVLLIAIVLFAAIPMVGQTKTTNPDKSGEATVSEKRNLMNFEKIDITGKFTVTLYASSQPEVSINTAEEYIPLVETKIEDNTLKVKIVNPDNNNFFKNIKAKFNDYIVRSPIEIRIGIANLSELNVNGISTIKSETPLNSSTLLINLSEASKADLTISAENLFISLAGASKIKLAGKADGRVISEKVKALLAK